MCVKNIKDVITIIKRYDKYIFSNGLGGLRKTREKAPKSM